MVAGRGRSSQAKGIIMGNDNKGITITALEDIKKGDSLGLCASADGFIVGKMDGDKSIKCFGSGLKGNKCLYDSCVHHDDYKEAEK